MAIEPRERGTAAKTPSPCVKWSVPRWSTARDLKRVVPLVFGFRPVIRIIGGSLLVGTAICVCAKAAVPQLHFAFIGRALAIIPGIFLVVAVNVLLQLLVGGQVKITDRYILHNRGQSTWRVAYSDVQSSKLVVYSHEHLYLLIRAKGWLHKIALPPTADVRGLTRLLDGTDVLDKRREFTAARAAVRNAHCADDCARTPKRTHEI